MAYASTAICINVMKRFTKDIKYLSQIKSKDQHPFLGGNTIRGGNSPVKGFLG